MLLRHGIQAFKGLRRSPAFAIVVVLLLGVTCGITAGLLNFADVLLLRPLAVREPSQLVMIQRVTDAGIRDSQPMSAVEHFAGRKDLFSDVVPWRESFSQVEWNNATARTVVLYVGPDYFSMLGIRPVAGSLGKGSDLHGAVLSYRFWRDRCGSDPHIMGKTVRVGVSRVPVIAVVPPDFRGLLAAYTADVTLPMEMEPTAEQSSDPSLRRLPYQVTVRLKPHISREQAQAALQASWPAYLAATTQPGTTVEARRKRIGRTVVVTPGGRGYLYPILEEIYAGPIKAVLAMGGLALVAALASFSGLVLARGARRRHEFAVMAALGATRFQIALHSMLESAGAVCAGGVAAIAVALLVSRAAESFLPLRNIVMTFDHRLGGLALAVIVATTLGALVLSVFWTWVQVSSLNLQNALSQAGRVVHNRARFRRVLVSAQVAAAMAIVVCAFSAGQTVWRLKQVEPGFPKENLLIANMEGNATSINKTIDQPYVSDLIARLRGVPGVEAAGVAAELPMSLAPPHKESIARWNDPGKTVQAESFCVYPGYFRAMGIPLIEGSDIPEQEDAAGPAVAVVNTVLARKLWGAESAVGGQIIPSCDNCKSAGAAAARIMGVSRSVRYSSLRAEPGPAIYRPCTQLGSGSDMWEMKFLFIRTHPGVRGSRELHAAIQREVEGVGRHIAVSIRTVETQMDDASLSERMLSAILLTFAGLVLVVACCGLCALLLSMAEARRPEFGVRLAVGATASQLVSLMLWESWRLVAPALAAGALLSVAAVRVLGRYLRGIESPDSWSYMLAAAAIALSATAVVLWPAIRAGRTDPVLSLRGGGL